MAATPAQNERDVDVARSLAPVVAVYSCGPNDRIQPRAKRDGCNAWLDDFAFAVTAIALRSRP